MILDSNIRESTVLDFPKLMEIRMSVKENTLSDPALIPDDDYFKFCFTQGKGWVYEVDSVIVGFSIVDLVGNNIWALFVDPQFEKKGIGKKLHDKMINWYFDQTKTGVWLGTEPHSRAEQFYRKSGWKEIGLHGKNEIKFEMTFQDWTSIKGK
jgi:GNAT superfamily N-acetyltransferase